MMSDGSVSTAINPFSRRKKKFKQKNSSPGIPPHVGGWDGQTLNAAAAATRHNSATLKIFEQQKGSVFAVPPLSADNSVGTAVNPCARRKNKVKQKNSFPGIPPQVEDWDLDLLVPVHGVKDGIGVVCRDLTLNGPLTGGYIPAIHHAQPLRWVRQSVPTEPDQFADADDSPGTPPQVEVRDRGIAHTATKLGSVAGDGVKGGIGGAWQDWTLNGPLTGAYTPAVHHAQPVPWVRQRVPIEPDQFADADK